MRDISAPDEPQLQQSKLPVHAMTAAAAAVAGVWEEVAEYTKAAQEKGCDPVAWAVQLTSALAAAGAPPPSTELAHFLVSHICWENENVPLAWKYLERALAAGLAPAPLALALLSSRVIPARRSRPVAYRLFMELIRRHMFSFASQIGGPRFKKIMAPVDDVLHLSYVFGIELCEPGVIVIGYVFCIIWKLLDALLEDEGLLELTPEKKSLWATTQQDMEVDGGTNFRKRSEYTDKMHKENTNMTVELLLYFLQTEATSRLLSLAREIIPSHWEAFVQRIRLLAMKSPTVRNSSASETLLQWEPCGTGIGREQKAIRKGDYRKIIGSKYPISAGGYYHGVTCSSLWIPLDLYLEDCIDGSVAATNAIEILSGLVKALRALNGTTWHDAFLGLWMASLRLVQRERDPIEGPVPRLDARLCMLLSITTLSIADIIEEEEAHIEVGPKSLGLKEKTGSMCRKDLVSSLQTLGDYESLLVPPPSVVSAANQAAAKAMMFISGRTVGNGFVDVLNINEKMINCSGNMRHLIVEACISRNLLDNSVYFWPGYVHGRINQIPNTIPNQVPSWSALMKGAPLTAPMVNALENTPATGLAELEKLFETAVNGSDEDKISAAIVLCGASLIRGWNIQEHTVRFVVKLLSPSIPIDYVGSGSHLISHAPMLNVVLEGISSVDCVQVFSYHGLVPELAAALMAICEVFGSCVPDVTWIAAGEEISAHTVFSNAFILLLRLWKFNHPPLEYCIMGDGAPVGSQLTPEYLLLLRNARLSFTSTMAKYSNFHRVVGTCASSSSDSPIFVDSFPKLKIWYRQHQACLASTLSGLVPGTVHQNVDCILSMMFRKISRGRNQSVGPGTSGSSLSSLSSPGSEDNIVRPKLPSWDIMEAVPFVVDAALSACSHGTLSPRELATGLKDLADFLPASLATIVSYFSAEVTRGVWKPAYMNGTDWPSPAANLSTVEELIKKIVAATGVDVPSLVAGGSSPAALPLPLAAFVSLTITYKLDKASERFLNLAGPALESLAASCPWPSMPIVAALWTQKVKRWSDFLVFSASRTVFHHNNDAVLQLLRSCFTATLGLSPNPISSNGGVGNLLGHGFGSHFSGGLSPVAPGILYLRVYRCIKDIIFLSDQILSLLLHSVKEIAESIHLKDGLEKLKKAKYGARYRQISFATSMTRVKVAAELGATFVWLSGGSGLVQSVIQETLPSWFLSGHELDVGVGSGGLAYTLCGHALAYFTVLCAMFAWGISAAPVTKRRPRLISVHMEFVARTLDGKISLGCDSALWRAYVSRFLSLILECAPCWLVEMEPDVLKRLTRGLRQWKEDELALALLERGGAGAAGAAAELILLTLHANSA